MSRIAALEHDATADAWFSERLAESARSRPAGGQVAMIERAATEGSMPPLVRRSDAETYRVLDGEVLFFVDNDVVRASPGDVVVAPAGSQRTFRVVSAEARWLVLTHVRSLDRFADFGRAVSAAVTAPSARWPCEHERAAVAALGAANGIEVLGPPGALPAAR